MEKTVLENIVVMQLREKVILFGLFVFILKKFSSMFFRNVSSERKLHVN